MTRLRASTHIERVALTLTTLAAFYAIWLGIGLPGLAPEAANGGRATEDSVVVSQIGAHPRGAHRLAQRTAVHAPEVRTRTRLVSAISRPAVTAVPPAAVAAPPAPTTAPPDRQPAVTPPPVAPPPPVPGATTPGEPQLPQPPPSTTPADVVQSVAATAQSTVDTAAGAPPPLPDVPDVGSLVPSLSH